MSFSFQNAIIKTSIYNNIKNTDALHTDVKYQYPPIIRATIQVRYSIPNSHEMVTSHTYLRWK